MYQRPPAALLTDMTTTQGGDDMTNETDQVWREGYGWVTPSAEVAAVLAQEPAEQDEVA
jgi:hypothetical protein